jgi:hypothetical protein
MIRSLIDNSTDQVTNSFGKRAFENPHGRGLGKELNTRGLDHQPDTAELASSLGTPAQEAEVKTARCSDSKSRHERAEGRSKEGLSCA